MTLGGTEDWEKEKLDHLSHHVKWTFLVVGNAALLSPFNCEEKKVKINSNSWRLRAKYSSQGFFFSFRITSVQYYVMKKMDISDSTYMKVSLASRLCVLSKYFKSPSLKNGRYTLHINLVHDYPPSIQCERPGHVADLVEASSGSLEYFKRNQRIDKILVFICDLLP